MYLPKRIVVVVYEDFLLLDLAGPIGAFELVKNFAEYSYQIELCSVKGGPVHSSSGVVIETAPFHFDDPIDLLLVPGGPSAANAARDPELIAKVRQLAKRAVQTASVCTGSFLLAEAGLLSGKRVTTHWGAHDRLSDAYPDVLVDSGCIYMKDGNIWTSGGISAGIDMALALIEQDHGFSVSQQVARSLVVYHRRPGGQSQDSPLLEMHKPSGRFGGLLEWARARLHENLSVDRLADHIGLSSRQFSRAFLAETGVSPAKAIERIRVDSARAAVVMGREGLEVIARRYGFGNAVRMRRAFVRVLGNEPQSERRRGGPPSVVGSKPADAPNRLELV